MPKIILRSFAILAFVSVCLSTVIPLPPNEQTIRGMWVGFSSDANDFYRLELQDQGGLFASSFAGGDAKVYKINSWSLNANGEMLIKTSPISTNAYPILVMGKAKSSQIQLTIKGPGGGWMHEVTINKEWVIEKRMQILKSSMDQIANRGTGN